MNDPAILEFQNFDLDSPSKGDATLIDISSEPRTRNLSPDLSNRPARTGTQSFWTFEYYQQFFDVNTDEVKERIMWSMVPSMQKNYLDTYIKHNPDLYGPVWICTTLIFTIAVSGNIANYLQYATHANYHWHYDFHLISYAATAILSYVCLVPVGLWIFMKYNTTNTPLSFLELLCTYGYSLSIYVPAAMLSTIQVSWFQWGLILIAASLSVVVLVSSISPSVSGPKKLLVTGLMISLHYLLAVGFMLYFFHAPAYFTPISTPGPAPPEMSIAQNQTHDAVVNASAIKHI